MRHILLAAGAFAITLTGCAGPTPDSTTAAPVTSVTSATSVAHTNAAPADRTQESTASHDLCLDDLISPRTAMYGLPVPLSVQEEAAKTDSLITASTGVSPAWCVGAAGPEPSRLFNLANEAESMSPQE